MAPFRKYEKQFEKLNSMNGLGAHIASLDAVDPTMKWVRDQQKKLMEPIQGALKASKALLGQSTMLETVQKAEAVSNTLLGLNKFEARIHKTVANVLGKTALSSLVGMAPLSVELKALKRMSKKPF